jgi:hypothetical protein
MEATFRSESTQPPAHYHPYQVEDFIMSEGELTVQIGKKIKTFHQGDHLHIPKNTIHSMWNESGAITVINWQVRPALSTQLFFATVFEISNKNLNSRQSTLSLVQKIGLARRFKTEFRLAKPPRLVQDILFWLVAAITPLLSYRAKSEN